MSKKLSNEIIDQRLILDVRNIKRLDDCIGALNNIRFQCLISDCNYIWPTTPNNVLNKNSGCPRCSDRIKLTDQEIDVRLQERNIKRLGNCINGDTKIPFQCLIKECNFIWNATPNKVTNRSKRGCPKCARNIKLSNEEIDIRLLDRNIKRLGNYGSNSKVKVLFQCLIEDCNFKWSACPNNVLNGGKTGCPRCSFKKNEKIAYKYLKLSNFEIRCQEFIFNIIIKENRKIRVDFYFPGLNTIIEYNGRQHYQSVRFGGISKERANENFIKQQNRDSYLQSFCDQNNIRLIWIDGRKE